jgi:hypothetical protein
MKMRKVDDLIQDEEQEDGLWQKMNTY